MSQVPLYPLRFEPIYQYRLWGGRRLADLLTAPLPGDGPIGEAWVLSDREDHPSRVANGPLKGRTIAELLDQSPEPVLGKLAQRFRRFPLLLKFLDAREMLSVQVHPSDKQTNLLPKGESGKTEAWVVLEAGTRKPHLCRPEAWHHGGGSALGAEQRDGGGRPRMLHSEARRRRFPAGRDSSLSGRRTSWCSRFSRTATLRFACTTGAISTPRRANRGHSKSSRLWLALILRNTSRSGRTRRRGDYAT